MGGKETGAGSQRDWALSLKPELQVMQTKVWTLAAWQLLGSLRQSPAAVRKKVGAHWVQRVGAGEMQLTSLYWQQLLALTTKLGLQAVQPVMVWLAQLGSLHLPLLSTNPYLQLRQSPVWMLLAWQKTDTCRQPDCPGYHPLSQLMHLPMLTGSTTWQFAIGGGVGVEGALGVEIVKLLLLCVWGVMSPPNPPFPNPPSPFPNPPSPNPPFPNPPFPNPPFPNPPFPNPLPKPASPKPPPKSPPKPLPKPESAAVVVVVVVVVVVMETVLLCDSMVESWATPWRICWIWEGRRQLPWYMLQPLLQSWQVPAASQMKQPQTAMVFGRQEQPTSLNPSLQLTHTPFAPVVRQFPVLSVHVPLPRVKPGRQAGQGSAAEAQLMVPTHFLPARTVPKAQLRQAVSSEGSVSRQAEQSLRHCPLEMVQVASQAKHWLVGPQRMQLGMVWASTQVPITLSWKPSPQAKHTLAIGSQSLQFAGHPRTAPATHNITSSTRVTLSPLIKLYSSLSHVRRKESALIINSPSNQQDPSAAGLRGLPRLRFGGERVRGRGVENWGWGGVRGRGNVGYLGREVTRFVRGLFECAEEERGDLRNGREISRGGWQSKVVCFFTGC